ncbi:MAG: hypothetical protein CVU38_12515 [Chloroflexi bacterium HGW-Chloroflexi-1]|nr:MAG: hypothetical protein CVU38_12515 [Chloroflexi bacterium HGW-Chloroflexi-1]
MTVLTLRLSNQPVITLPAELARLAGLEEGQVQVISNQQRVTVVPVPVRADYAVQWESMAAILREQATQFDLTPADRRDASYWETVAPLFAEAERLVGSA